MLRGVLCIHAAHCAQLYNMFNLFKKKKKKVGCPVCYDDRTISFGMDYLESNFESDIRWDKEIGGVRICRCLKCANPYFIEDNVYNKILPGQLTMLQEWSDKDLITPNPIKAQLELIGITDNWNKSKVVPCKIVHKNGKTLDFTTVQFSLQPPLGHYYSNYKDIFLIDDLLSIEKSDFALSKEIREAAFKAEERRMGFYPTVLKDKYGQKIAVNGPSLFFDANNVKGSELTLANEQWNHKEKYFYEEKVENNALIIAKK